MSTQSTSQHQYTPRSAAQNWSEGFAKLLNEVSPLTHSNSRQSPFQYSRRKLTWADEDNDSLGDRHLIELTPRARFSAAIREMFDEVNYGVETEGIVDLPSTKRFPFAYTISRDPSPIAPFLKPLLPLAENWSARYHETVTNLARLVHRSFSTAITENTSGLPGQEDIKEKLEEWRDLVEFRESLNELVETLHAGSTYLEKKFVPIKAALKDCGIDTQIPPLNDADAVMSRSLLMAAALTAASSVALSLRDDLRDYYYILDLTDPERPYQNNQDTRSLGFLHRHMAKAISLLNPKTPWPAGFEETTQKCENAYQSTYQKLRNINVPNDESRALLTLADYKNHHKKSTDSMAEADKSAVDTALARAESAAREAAANLIEEMSQLSPPESSNTSPSVKKAKKKSKNKKR